MNKVTKLPGDIGAIHFVGIGGIGMSGPAAAFLCLPGIDDPCQVEVRRAFWLRVWHIERPGFDDPCQVEVKRSFWGLGAGLL